MIAKMKINKIVSVALLLFGLNIGIHASQEETKRINTLFYTIQIPTSYKTAFFNTFMPMKQTFMVEKSSSPTNFSEITCIVAFREATDLDLLLKTEIMHDVYLKSAVVKNQRISNFLGNEGRTLDLSVILSGVKYDGSMVVFVHNGVSYLILEMYSDKKKLKLDAMLKTIRFKEKLPMYTHKEFLTSFDTNMATAKKLLPMTIAPGIHLVGIDRPSEASLLYSLKIDNFLSDDTTGVYYKSLIGQCKSQMLVSLKNKSKSDLYISECMKMNFEFQYLFYNRDNKMLFQINLNPEDYNK